MKAMLPRVGLSDLLGRALLSALVIALGMFDLSRYRRTSYNHTYANQ
jgi:hypothetical protein